MSADLLLMQEGGAAHFVTAVDVLFMAAFVGLVAGWILFGGDE